MISSTLFTDCEVRNTLVHRGRIHVSSVTVNHTIGRVSVGGGGKLSMCHGGVSRGGFV